MHLSKRLSILALSALMCHGLMAQKGYTVYDFLDLSFDMVDEDGTKFSNFLFGNFQHVSANGKYAVGSDETLTFRSFVWNADEPDVIEMVGDYKNEIVLNDVTNDGTLVGGMRNAKGMMYPAYKPQGAKWQLMTRGMERLNKDMATTGNVAMALRATTPDGQYMAGSFYMNTGKIADNGVEISHLVPVVFKDGQLFKIYDDLGLKDFMVWDISDDGQTIVGMEIAGIGGQNPAFIRDGKVYRLFECGDERTIDTPDDVYGNVAGGICNNIDNMGNIYGYYEEALTETYAKQNFFVVPAGCDYAIFIDPAYSNDKFPQDYYTKSWYICGGNGKQYTVRDSHLEYLLDCSDDGRVMVGNGAYNLGFGVAAVPTVCVFDEPQAPNKLHTVADAISAQGISLNAHSLIVNGVYSQASIYDTKGNRVACGGQGQPLTLPEGHGIYMVKVKYAEGEKTYKFGR